MLSVKEADGNSLLLEIASPESEEWAGVDLSGIEIENGKFVFDKILVNAFPGEKEHFTEVSPADIAAGQIKIELPEGYSRYEISAYTSHLRPCYAAYGSLSYKPDYLERGFMLLGTDGTTDNTVVGMLSMKTDGDTVMIDRALTFDGMFHKPRKLYYSGSYIDSYGEALWILGEEESWKISAADATDCPALQPLGTFSSLIPYGTINSPVHVDDDEQAVDIFPKRAPGGGNLYRSVSLAITDKACYGPEMTISGKGFFFQPVNRMANTPDSPLFNFYPSFFYNGSLTYMSWTSTPFYIYDTDNDRFVKITVTGLNGTHCQVLPDNSFAAWRWDCKSENRSLVYGQNTATPDKGYSYFIMRSTADDNVFDIYSLHIPSSYTQNKEKFAVDLSLAKDFDKASMYTFIGCRRAVFYSVGSVLHQYDFEKGLHTAMDLGAEITMIKPEYYSVNRQDDLMVATWDSSASQGSFMKLRIGSDPAKVEMNIRNDFDNAKYLEKWTTRIKI
ncbi:MAG: hypothetical protein K2K72_06715, partial [Duncaniella sp.]|nr:hypothetical protein [Duncaniella sp.]